MTVFIYSPGVRVLVDTRKNGLIEVTDDLTNGTLTLRENAPHSFQFGITNMRRKYDGLFTPNDRIVVYMKRVKWLLCFTGYLNSVPYFTAYPRSVALDATCTLKRLQYHFWDPGTTASYNLLHQGPAAGSTDKQQDVDGGLKDKAMAVLTQVVGWDKQKIHIGAIPGTWMSKVSDLYNSLTPRIGLNASTIGAAPSMGLNDPYADGKQQIDPAADKQLPATFGSVTNNDPSIQGTFNLNGETPSYRDQWYCAMRWPYLSADGSHYMLPGDELASKRWWENRQILVVNPRNLKAVILRAVAWGPDNIGGRAIAVSPEALISLGANVDDSMHIAFAPDQASVGEYNASNSSSPSLRKIEFNDTPVPTITGAPSTTLVGAAAAISFAQAQMGKTYVSGGGRPFVAGTTYQHYDCSGLTGSAWAQGGVQIGNSSQEQYRTSVDHLGNDQSTWLPGDLVFYFPDGNGLPDHVALYIGGGKQIAATSPDDPIITQDVFTSGLMGAGRVKGQQPGDQSSLTAALASNGATGAGSTNSNGPNLINAWDWFGSGPSGESDSLSGSRALMNDEPVMPTIDMLIQASMRSYCAAPNGDFISWFPDYFGAYQSAAKIDVYNIELQDFSITWSDDHLITHQFVAGSSTGGTGTPQPGGPVEAFNMYMTQGIVSVEFSEVLDALFNVQGSQTPFGSTQEILDRYGARPNFQAMGTLQAGGMGEFWYALSLFQRNWAQQFTANIPLTFMPELWPGMLIHLPEYKFQAYCNQVVHTFNFGEGGGFSTNAYVSAPSTDAVGGSTLWGINKSGVGA